MLYACFYTICLVFRYTSWRFYEISGTNLLTRCHSASSLFFAVLCFRKATQEIFSELDETSSRSFIFPGRRTRTKREPEGGPGAALTPGWRSPGLGRAPYVGGDPGCPLTTPLRLYKASERKTLRESAKKIYAKKWYKKVLV
jgi:hypothetical protein